MENEKRKYHIGVSYVHTDSSSSVYNFKREQMVDAVEDLLKSLGFEGDDKHMLKQEIETSIGRVLRERMKNKK